MRFNFVLMVLLFFLILPGTAKSQDNASSSLNLVPPDWNSIKDFNGISWSISRNGSISQGYRYVFNRGMAMQIDGNQFNSNTSLMTSDGAEYVLKKEEANHITTRRVRIDKQRGGAVYLDIFENTGDTHIAETVVYSIYFRYVREVYTDTGKIFSGSLEKSESGLFIKSGQRYPGVVMAIGDPHAEVTPEITVDKNRRMITIQYTIDLKPQSKKALLHMLFQYNHGVISEKNVSNTYNNYFRYGRIIAPHISRKLIPDIKNFRVYMEERISFNKLAMISDVIDAAKGIGIDLEKESAVVLGPEDILHGEIQPCICTIKTEYGICRVPISEVLFINGGMEDRQSTMVHLRNGEILTGSLDVDHLRICTGTGLNVNLDPDYIMYLFNKSEKTDGLPDGYIKVFFETGHKERIGVNSLENIGIKAVTPLGSLDIPLAQINTVKRKMTGLPFLQISLKDGSIIYCIFQAQKLSLPTIRFGTVTIDTHNVLGIISVNTVLEKLQSSLPAGHENVLGKKEILKKIAFSCEKTSLSAVCSQLKEQAGIALSVDPEDNYITTTKVSLACGNRSVYSIILSMMEEYGLACKTDGNGLIITSPNKKDTAKENGTKGKWGTFTVKGGNILTGTFKNDELSVETSIGNVKISRKKIKFIEMHKTTKNMFVFRFTDLSEVQGRFAENVCEAVSPYGNWKIPVRYLISYSAPEEQ